MFDGGSHRRGRDEGWSEFQRLIRRLPDEQLRRLQAIVAELVNQQKQGVLIKMDLLAVVKAMLKHPLEPGRKPDGWSFKGRHDEADPKAYEETLH